MRSILSSLRNLFSRDSDRADSSQRPVQRLIANELVFEVVEIKRGGMGIVYICNLLGPESETPHGRLALKTFDEKFFFDVNMSIAVATESSLWMRLSEQPFIFPVMSTLTIDQKPYLVMPVAEPDEEGNVSVADVVRKAPTGLPLKECLRLALCLSTALSAAAQHIPGVVHGDIKPDNILFLGGYPFLADFGLAQLGQRVGRRGTPAYMAPELWEADGALSLKTDIYAFGVTIFEVMCGSLPFGSSEATLESWSKLHSSHEPRFPDHLNGPKELEAELKKLISRCLAKSPADRPDTFEDINSELFIMGMLDAPETTLALLQHRAGLAAISHSQKAELAHIRVSNLLENGEFETALEVLSALPDSAITDRLLLLAGSTYSLNDDDERALEYFERFLTTDPSPTDRVRCLSETGLSLRRLGRLEEARDLFSNLMEEARGSQRITVRGNYAGVLLDLNELEEARRELQWLTRNHPESPEGWALYATALMRLDKLEDAVEAAKKAIQRSPRNGNYYVLLADLFFRSKRAYESLAALDKAYGLGYHTRQWAKLTIAASLILDRQQDVEWLISNLQTQLTEDQINTLEAEALSLVDEFHADQTHDATEKRNDDSPPDATDQSTTEPRVEEEDDETSDSAAKAEDEEASAAEHMRLIRSGKQPHAQVRLSFVDSSFAIDFYYDVKSPNYVELFKDSYDKTKWRMETTAGAEREQQYRFAQCQSCRFLVLTTRDEGERFACQACGERGPANTFRSDSLDELLMQCEQAIGRHFTPAPMRDDLTLVVAFWTDEPSKAATIAKRMESEGFFQAPPDAAAFAFFRMEMTKRGVALADPVTQVWAKRIAASENLVADRTPAFLDRIIRELRREVGTMHSASAAFGQEAEFMLSDLAGSARLARQLVAENPDNNEAKGALVSAELMAGNLADAKRVAAAMELADPDDLTTLLAAAQVSLAEEKPHEAIWRLERIVAARPRNRIARGLLIKAYDAAGNPAKAAQHLAELQTLGGY